MTPETLILSNSAWPSTSRSTKSPVVAVTTPAMLTFSKLVCPFASKRPEVVVTPDIINPLETVGAPSANLL